MVAFLSLQASLPAKESTETHKHTHTHTNIASVCHAAHGEGICLGSAKGRGQPTEHTALPGAPLFRLRLRFDGAQVASCE